MEKKHKRIKILYTIPNFNTAGSGKVLYDLANGIDRELFEVHIACHHSKGFFFKEIEALGFPIHILNTTQPLRPYVTFLKRIIPFQKFIKNHRFDIVHSWHWSSDWSEVLAVRMAGAKYVYTKKAMTWGNIHWKIKSFLSHFIITINDEMHKYFTYKKNQLLIPLGIDTNYYHSNVNLDKLSKSTTFTIVTVANLVPVKGIEILIKAINHLDNKNIQLKIVGDNNTQYAEKLNDLVKSFKLENQFFFLGKHNDVRPFLVEADLYIMPSEKEGLGMALIEAMAMGVTVLGSNVSGINYVLRDFPELLFEAGNVKQLSHAIQHWMNASADERKAQGAALRTYCQQHYSLEQSIRTHEQLYLQLCRR